MAGSIKSKLSRVGMMIDPDHSYLRETKENKKGGK
jgi:hypothetical protein